EPPARELVDRAGHVRNEVGVPIADAADHRAELRHFRFDGRGGQQRPAFALVALRTAVEWEKVAPKPDAVHSELIGAAPCVAKLSDGALLRMDGDADLEAFRFGHWSGTILSIP